MIDETTVSAVRSRLSKLLPYRKQVRPGAAASFPPFMDGELQRLDTTTRDIVGSLQALDPILEALTGDQGAAFPEAPVDGQPYARRDAGWTPVATIQGPKGDKGDPGTGAAFPEAPADGQLYARKDGGWAAFEPGAGGGSEGPEGRATGSFRGAWTSAQPLIRTVTFDDGVFPPPRIVFPANNNRQWGIINDPDGPSGTAKALTIVQDNSSNAYGVMEFVVNALDNARNLSVRYRTGGENNYDGTIFRVDGNEVGRNFGNPSSYLDFNYTFPTSGPHTVQIVYDSDGSIPGGIQNVRIAKIVYPDGVDPNADPYRYGDTVTHNGAIWYSLRDNNPSVPGTNSDWSAFSSTLARLSDIDMSKAPTAGQMLAFSGGKWRPTDPPVGGDGGGGGGGSSRRTPAIVQQAIARGSGTFTLDLGAKPTQGNLLVLFWTGYSGSTRSWPAGFNSLGGQAYGSQGFDCLIRYCDGTETSRFTVSANDNNQWLLCELESCKIVQPGGIAGISMNGNSFSRFIMDTPIDGALRVLCFEHDTTGDWAFPNLPAGISVIYNSAGIAGNHRGAFLLVQPGMLANLTGTLQSPTQPMVVEVTLGG